MAMQTYHHHDHHGHASPSSVLAALLVFIAFFIIGYLAYDNYSPDRKIDESNGGVIYYDMGLSDYTDSIILG